MSKTEYIGEQFLGYFGHQPGVREQGQTHQWLDTPKPFFPEEEPKLDICDIKRMRENAKRLEQVLAVAEAAMDQLGANQKQVQMKDFIDAIGLAVRVLEKRK